MCVANPGRSPGGCTTAGGSAGGGGVMLWEMLCWKDLGPDIHMNVTLTLTTYLNQTKHTP